MKQQRFIFWKKNESDVDFDDDMKEFSLLLEREFTLMGNFRNSLRVGLIILVGF